MMKWLTIYGQKKQKNSENNGNELNNDRLKSDAKKEPSGSNREKERQKEWGSPEVPYHHP